MEAEGGDGWRRKEVIDRGGRTGWGGAGRAGYMESSEGSRPPPPPPRSPPPDPRCARRMLRHREHREAAWDGQKGACGMRGQGDATYRPRRESPMAH